MKTAHQKKKKRFKKSFNTLKNVLKTNKQKNNIQQEKKRGGGKEKRNKHQELNLR